MKLCVSYTRVSEEGMAVLEPLISDIPHATIKSSSSQYIQLRPKPWERKKEVYSEEDLDTLMREFMEPFLDMTLREYLIETGLDESGPDELRVIMADRIVLIEHQHFKTIKTRLDKMNVKGLHWYHLGYGRHYASSEYAYENTKGKIVIRLVRFRRPFLWDRETNTIERVEEL